MKVDQNQLIETNPAEYTCIALVYQFGKIHDQEYLKIDNEFVELDYRSPPELEAIDVVQEFVDDVSLRNIVLPYS
jgi:hypothetical protein